MIVDPPNWSTLHESRWTRFETKPDDNGRLAARFAEAFERIIHLKDLTRCKKVAERAKLDASARTCEEVARQRRLTSRGQARKCLCRFEPSPKYRQTTTHLQRVSVKINIHAPLRSTVGPTIR